MPIAPPLQQLIEAKLAHARAPQWELPIAEVREAFRALWRAALTGAPLSVDAVEELVIHNGPVALAARLYAPERGHRLPLLVYLHGGGYVKGGLDESDVFCRNLSWVSRHIVVSIDYRLAPEHPFSAALDDAIEATAWVCNHAEALGAAEGPVVICGESAGGNLAAATCLAARLDPRLAIRCQVLLQPVLDFTLGCASISMPPTECLVPRADLEWYYRTYAGARHDPKDPRLSPLHASDLSGLPPALIIAAEYDTLRDEAEAYAKRLDAAGVPTRYRCYPGMIHGFLQMGGLVPEAREAIDEIARALAQAASPA
jgi:acetyl esterase